MLQCEMDTSAHDINRVYFTTHIGWRRSALLSPRLFKDEYDEAAVAAEGKSWKSVKIRTGRNCRKERTRQTSIMSLKEEFKKDSQGVFKGQEFKNSRISTSAASASAASTLLRQLLLLQHFCCSGQLSGIPYGKSLRSGGRMYNDGQEPMRSKPQYADL